MNKGDESFNRFIAISVAFHAFIFIALTVKFAFFPDKPPEYKQAVRVDVVALPEKNVEPPKPIKKLKPKVAKKPKPKPKKPKPKVAKKPKPKPKPKVALKPKKNKIKDEQNSAIDRLRALQKLKDKEKIEEPTQQEFKGNQVSKGNSLTGLAKLHHESYLDELDSHIRTHWNLPEWLANGNFKARVLLLINKSGGISGKSFVLKSGNDLFDQHVFTTLEKASPLPAPPTNLRDFYATKGVEIRFPE